MIRQLSRLRAIFVVAIQRLLAQPLLTIATIVGLTIAVGLILTIPVYAESVAFRVLTERLTADEDTSNLPPFSYFFTYIGSFNQPINLEATANLDNFLRNEGSQSLGLNTTQIVRHVETRNFRLYPSDESDYANEDRILDFVSFGMTQGIEEHIELVEGRLPQAGDTEPDSVIEVIIHEQFATEFGIQAGNPFIGYNWRLEAGDALQIMPIQVVGIWRPIDGNSEYWFYRPYIFQDILLINPETYANRLAPYTDEEVNLAIWYVVADGSNVNTSRVNELVERHEETERRVSRSSRLGVFGFSLIIK